MDKFKKDSIFFRVYFFRIIIIRSWKYIIFYWEISLSCFEFLVKRLLFIIQKQSKSKEKQQNYIFHNITDVIKSQLAKWFTIKSRIHQHRLTISYACLGDVSAKIILLVRHSWVGFIGIWHRTTWNCNIFLIPSFSSSI